MGEEIMGNQKKHTIERRDFVARLIKGIPDALIVTGLGSPSYDVFAAGDRHQNFYLWGAMGGSTSLGLGLALAQKDKSVVVITGDGEQLMGIGSLATIGGKQPKNLTIVALDNGHFGETGMQQSHTSLGTDLVAVAKGCGIADAYVVSEASGVDQVIQRVNARSNVSFAQVYISTGEPPRALPARDGVFIKNRFRAALGFESF
jgi:thiamine pyrophosphate-dependent acetolactate synthase large subunit-like protein